MTDGIVLLHCDIALVGLVEREGFRIARRLLHVVIVVEVLTQVVLEQSRVQKLRITESHDHLLSFCEEVLVACFLDLPLSRLGHPTEHGFHKLKDALRLVFCLKFGHRCLPGTRFDQIGRVHQTLVLTYHLTASDCTAGVALAALDHLLADGV